MKYLVWFFSVTVIENYFEIFNRHFCHAPAFCNKRLGYLRCQPMPFRFVTKILFTFSWNFFQVFRSDLHCVLAFSRYFSNMSICLFFRLVYVMLSHTTSVKIYYFYVLMFIWVNIQTYISHCKTTFYVDTVVLIKLPVAGFC